MKARVLISLPILALAGLIIWQSLPPKPPELSFAANGVVEQADFKQDTCIVKIAIYEWTNLSQGFELKDIPMRSDRYVVHGSGQTCQALPIAMSGANQHISFEVSSNKNQWSFITNPSAALGCGGLQMNWKPDPES